MPDNNPNQATQGFGDLATIINNQATLEKYYNTLANNIALKKQPFLSKIENLRNWALKELSGHSSTTEGQEQLLKAYMTYYLSGLVPQNSILRCRPATIFETSPYDSAPNDCAIFWNPEDPLCSVVGNIYFNRYNSKTNQTLSYIPPYVSIPQELMINTTELGRASRQPNPLQELNNLMTPRVQGLNNVLGEIYIHAASIGHFFS